jgi:hypothetical protein
MQLKSPSSEINRLSATQEIPRNSKDHHRVHKSPLRLHILSQKISIQPSNYNFEKYFNIILPSIPRSSK